MAAIMLRPAIYLSVLGAAAVCVGVYCLRDRSPHVSMRPIAEGDAAANTAHYSGSSRSRDIAAIGKPAAMKDPVTYAAERLREIKADPTPWSDVWTWRREFALADTAELRREVAGLARQVGPDSFLAVLAQALSTDDAVLRLDAARSIATLPENRMGEGIQIGVGAPDAETRREVMDVIEQVQPHLRPELLRVVLVNGGWDVQNHALELLTDHPTPENFAALIEGLRTTAGETRRSLEEAIASMVGESLTDYEAATRWWSENQERFDGMMARVQ